MTTTDSSAHDREQIRAHIAGLFEAFIRKDRDHIRSGHTADWRGFQVKSTHLVRGIDDYMSAADAALAVFAGRRYEITDLEIQLHGDVAVVFYVADWWIEVDGTEKILPLRAVDIYRREHGHWNQSGSNISLVPQPAG